MTDTPDTSPQPTPDRIAKVMARAGVASRREAERMILEGRVAVNGKAIDSPALDVLPGDRITVDGKKLEEPQETRLWLYYKPVGLVTSEADEKGRQTVFDALPRDLPRVMTIGRLDLTSEGLLLLTNDGELKRRLELPSTGWLRRYRVRVNGTPNDLTFAPLRRGVTIDGEEFAPMEIKLDSQQGANAWLTVGIREGKNREIRRAMAHIGLQVNRLIRVGYGPFKLTGMEKNEVVEVKRRVLRDQLGGLLTGEDTPKDREMRPRGAEGARAPRRTDGEAPRRSFRTAASDAERGPRTGGFEPRDGAARFAKPRFAGKDEGERPRFRGKPGAARDEGERPARAWGGKSDDSRPRGPRPAATGQAEGKRRDGQKPGYAPRGDGRPEGERGYAPRGAGKPGGTGGRGGKPAGDGSFKPRGEGKPGGFGSHGKPAREGGFTPRDAGKAGGPAARGKPGEGGGFKPRGEGKPTGERRSFGKPAGTKPARGDAPRGRPGGKPGGRPGGKPRT